MHDFNELQSEETTYPNIVQDLRTTYRLKPEEQQVLERVRERLAHSASSATNLDVVYLDEKEIPAPVEEMPRVTPSDTRRTRRSHTISDSGRKRWLSPFNSLVAVLVCCVLVGLLGFLFATLHYNQTTVGSSGTTQGIKFWLAPMSGDIVPSQAVLSATRDALQQRFDDFGLYNASVTSITINGRLLFSVSLPNFGGNEEQTINTLVGKDVLEFWITGTKPLNAGDKLDPTQYTQYNPGNKPEFTGADLDPNSLSTSVGPIGTAYEINFAMKSGKAATFGTFTSNNIGQVMTVTLDRKVLVSATIQSAITGPGQITGIYTQQQAQAIVTALKTGSLPISLQRVAH